MLLSISESLILLNKLISLFNNLQQIFVINFIK